MDEVMRDYACLPTSVLAQEAGRELKVVFSGEGGDEVCAGYRRYRPSLAERWVKGLLRPDSGGFRTRGRWQARWTRRAGRGGGRELWALVQFASWHRLFVEHPGLAPTPDENPVDWIPSAA
jgi:asparagine synthetase B (glutamine-hydrolysing)